MITYKTTRGTMNQLKSMTLIVVAGGTGSRFGGDLPKQFIKIAGLEMFAHSVKICCEFKQLSQIVVVADSEYNELVKTSLSFTDIQVTICSPGITRQQSVFNALQMVNETTDVVLIHDGARPVVKTDLIQRLIDKLDESKAVIPLILVTDSILEVDESGEIKQYVDRSKLRRVQTPQAFFYKDILNAHKKALQDELEFTDDAGLYRNYGGNVATVPGDKQNIKVTHKSDLSFLNL